MVQLTAKLNSGAFAALATDIAKRVRAVETAEQAARRTGATVATATTRDAFHYKRTPAPSRPGRRSTGGAFKKYLDWQPIAGAKGNVSFDLAKADAEVPYWIILEIGTGESATIRRAGITNPRGRPTAGATYVRTVPSAIGRRIPGSLSFSTGPGGFAYRPSREIHNQQLYPRRSLRRASRRVPDFRITKEVEGQHFVKKGGTEGFRAYQNEVRAAARRAFAGRGA